MGFKEDFKKGWKGHAGTEPSESLLEALSKNEGFKERKNLKSILGLTSGVIDPEEEIICACLGNKKEGDVHFFAILAAMSDRVILAQHSMMQTFPKFEVSEIPYDKVSNVRVRKDKVLLGEIIIETSGANLTMSSNTLWLEQAKSIILEKISTKKAPANAPEANNLSSELLQLSQMFKDGLLTQEEFQSAKAKLLEGK